MDVSFKRQADEREGLRASPAAQSALSKPCCGAAAGTARLRGWQSRQSRPLRQWQADPVSVRERSGTQR